MKFCSKYHKGLCVNKNPQPLPFSSFHKEKRLGYQSSCKLCQQAAYISKKDINGEKRREKYHENVDKERERGRKRSHTSKGRWKSHRASAKARKIENFLSFEQFDFLTKQKCFYCDKYSKDRDYVGIDRINSNLPYTLDNSRPCCVIHNYMKQDLNEQEFYDKCKEVIDKYDLIKSKGTK